MRSVDETADEAQIVVAVERDVREHERHVVVEAGQERLTYHRPRADRAARTDRLEGEVRIGRTAMRTHRLGRMHEVFAATATREHERSRCGGFPEGSRPLVGSGNRATCMLAHGMTAVSFSAAMSSHE